LTGWLEKNKDPMNDTVIDILKNGSNQLVNHIFADHPGQSNIVDRDDKGKGKGKKVKLNILPITIFSYKQSI
jgi:myosin heavy subunit